MSSNESGRRPRPTSTEATARTDESSLPTAPDDPVTDVARHTPDASAETAETTETASGASHPDDSLSPEAALRAAILADVERYFAETPLDEAFAGTPPVEFLRERFFDFGFVGGDAVVDYYWVNEPFAFVTVLHDEADHEYRYHVAEPALDEFETYVREDLTKVLRNRLLYRTVDYGTDRLAVFEAEAKRVMTRQAAAVEDGSLHKLLYYLLRDFIHLGRIDAIMRDPHIEDVSCDGADIPVFVYHDEHRDLPTNVRFAHPELTSFTVQLAQRAGKQLSVSDPLVDASLPDGSRIQLTLGSDISTRGSNFTIRKFSAVPYTPVDLIQSNTFTVDQMAYFWLAIENNRSLLFAGGTGSGKTTSMNAVSFFIPQNSKVVSIEDTREITLPHDNWIQSVTRDSFTADGRGEVSMYQLLQASLRQRPEYLLVGEIRTEPKVALTFFHAIATGHTAYSTVHADSVEGVLSRLRNEPLGVPAQLLDGLDVVSIQKQIYLDDTRVRRNLHVAELVDGDGEPAVHDVFARNPKTDTHERIADSQVLAAVAEERGWTEAELATEYRDRRDVLQYLVDNDITDYHDVAAIIHAFGRNPAYVLGLLGDRTLDPADLPAVAEEFLAGEDTAATVDDVNPDDEVAVEADGGTDESADEDTADERETAEERAE